MRCLKINDKWVNLILSGEKTWEIRRVNTRIREKIALGNKKTGLVVGYATLINSNEMTVEELLKYNDKHKANNFIKQYARGRKTLFVWFLKDVEFEKNPKQYSYSIGAWCKTDDRTPK